MVGSLDRSCTLRPPRPVAAFPANPPLRLAVLVLLNHYFWFRHFSHAQRSYRPSYAGSRGGSRYADPPDLPTFTEIASYFGLCVWLVPFALFVSLSASDNVLPTMAAMGGGAEEPFSRGGGRDDAKSSGGSRRQGLVKAIVDGALGAMGEVGRMAGWEGRQDRGGF